MDDLCFLSALELAGMIRAKKISAREVLSAHLRQIERVNPKVNAIVTLIAEQALEQARLADEAQAHGATLGALHGLPVAHKDLHDTAGVRTTYGARLYKDHVPVADAVIVERMKKAGAISVGKTNTPEFGFGSQTFNEVFGATRNPYDLSKTCGGSSGGAAVALACGMVALADGSDMGGSLRNPAAFCNVVGLRPAPGRVPVLAANAATSTLGVHGPMARSVADSAFLLSVIADAGAYFARPLDRAFNETRVAWASDLGGIPFDPRVRRIVDAQRSVFEMLGCKIDQAEPNFRDADEVFKTLRAWLAEANYGDAVRKHRDLFKDTVHWEVDRGAKLSGDEVGRGEAKRTALEQRMRAFMETYEYFILPVTQVPPFDLTQPYVTEINGVKMESYIDWMKSCWYISVVGNPAISVPCGFTDDGLPVGLQIVGRHQDEWGVLQLAHAFEKNTGFGKRRPEIAG